VRDHDGDVEVRTDRQTGTVFTLTLPLGLHA
jgi:chemotaxis protein histidine kinase CheA